MKKVKVIDEFTFKEVCTISIGELPKKDDFITLIETDDCVSYFNVKEIVETSAGAEVLILPVMREWVLGFHRMYGGKIHFLFAHRDYYSFQNKGVF